MDTAYLAATMQTPDGHVAFVCLAATPLLAVIAALWWAYQRMRHRDEDQP